MGRRRLTLMVLGLAFFALLIGRQVLWRGEEEQRMERMIEEAPRLIRQLPERQYPRELNSWFKALTKAGHVREARRMAEAIERPKMRSHALDAVAIGLFELDRMKEAAEVARSIPDPQLRDQTLRVVAIGFALSGTADTSGGREAAETAASVEDPDSRSAGLTDTARTLHIMSKDRAAEAATQQIDKPSDRYDAESSKAWALALKGQARQAIETADAIPEPGARFHALWQVAENLADRNPAEAIEAAERAAEVVRKAGGEESRARETLSEVLARTGQFDRAREVAEGIADMAVRGETLDKLVRAMVKRGETAGALKVARVIPDPRSRCSSLSALIPGAAERGPEDLLPRAVPELIDAAGAIEEPASRSEGFREAASALAKAGLSADAFRAAEAAAVAARQVKDPRERAYVLADAAGARSEARPGPESAAVARQVLEEVAPLADPYHRDGPLQRAAQALLRAVPDQAAVEVASTIIDPSRRALALTTLADILGGSRWDERVAPATMAADRALEAARSEADPAARASTLVTVMDVVARADRIPEASAAARSIPAPYDDRRSEALRTIATIQAERGRFDEAWQLAQGCSPADKLLVYSTILDTFATEEGRRRFAPRTPTNR